MLAIGVVEAISLVSGFSPSAAIEETLPDVDVPDVSAPEPAGTTVLDAPAASGAELGTFSQVLGWLSVGRLPLLMLFVIFLTAFGVLGWLVQWAALGAIRATVSPWLATVPALIGAAYSTRYLGRWLGRIFPRDHSEAASQNDLIGSYATIIRGEARKGQPAEAKTTDLRGRSHYVLLEPDAAHTTYAAGARVFIVGRSRNIYRAVTRLEESER